MIKAIQRTWQRVIAALKRLGLWLLAAAITCAVLFTAVLIYKWTVFEPEPPLQANCQSLQWLQSADHAIELGLFQCQRGRRSKWQGYELWLYEPADEAWQRLMTAPIAELQQPPCMRLRWRGNSLLIEHQQSRGDLSLIGSSVIYDDLQGLAQTLSITTERITRCSP